MKRISLYLLILIICISCNEQYDLSGIWERIDGDYKDMQIQIIGKGNNLLGKVILSPSNSYYSSTFIKNCIKWKDINKIDTGLYTLKSLTSRDNYRDSYLVFEDKNLLTIYDFINDDKRVYKKVYEPENK